MLLCWQLLFSFVVPRGPTGCLGAEEPAPLSGVRSFLERHCLDCHGAREQANGYRFDTLGTELSEPATLRVWQAIVDQLNRGSMPPKDRPQPAPAAVVRVVDQVTPLLRAAYARRRSTERQTVLRRLNRYELRNTLRDLLYLEDNASFRPDHVAKLEDRNGNGQAEWNSEDPTREFPADEVEEGFDNIGDRLVMSDFLLSRMISAAETCLALATRTWERPPTETREFLPPIRTEGPNPGIQGLARSLELGYDAIFQRYREPGASTGGLGRVTSNALARTGVGLSAFYRITIDVSAHNQRHDWGELIASRQDEPMQLGLHRIDSRRGGLHDGNPTSELVKVWELPGDGRRHTLEFTTWLDATWLPWIGWENGPFDRGFRASRLVQRYLPEAFQPLPKDASPDQRRDYEPAMARELFRQGYAGPHLRIHRLSIEPLLETWPPRSHTFLYGADELVPLEPLILRFAERAFRTPLKRQDVARFVELAKAQQQGGSSRGAALRAAYTAILVSPRFYYLEESPGRLSDYQLASRLSYFLWSSMPDEELWALAKRGELGRTDVIRQQVRRMLADPKAAAFVRHFTQRWLRLDKLGAMPPERGGPFRIYFDRQMESQMLAQTDAYFAHTVETNAPVRELIDSDYTFLNERVGSLLYGRDDVWGDGFRKVPVKDPRRGGILTLPSVMTATANGVDTSPVVRGVWVLESVLGTPPAPPPPDVEPLSPDLRGAKTIREQLQRHREMAACNSCHRRIDPLGFALENFDPIGRWREFYPGTRQKIDPSAELPDSERLADLVAFKQMLLRREADVTRCLVEKLLSYASGRLLEPADRGEVDAIIEALRSRSGGVRDAIELVAASELFRSK